MSNSFYVSIGWMRSLKLAHAIELKSNTTIEGIVRQVEIAGNGNMQNIIRVSKEQAVSSDFGGDTFSCILDLDSSLQLSPDFFKLICWYENEYSYACRIVDSIFFLERKYQLEWTSKMSYIRPSPKHSLLQTKDSNNKFTYHQACSYESHNSKSFRSSSQDSGFKSPKRPAIARKPLPVRNFGTKKLSDLNRVNRKNNELFKIWNDEDETVKEPTRQNRSSFFHSCVALTPQINTNASIKTRERLENVKREFSKMVIMTENLLKQSNHSKIKIGSPEISSNNLNNLTGEKVSNSEITTFSLDKAYCKPAIKANDNNNKEIAQDNKLSLTKNCSETATEANDDNIKNNEEDHRNTILTDNDTKINKNKSAVLGDIPKKEHNNKICNNSINNDKRTYSFEKLKTKIFNYSLTLTNNEDNTKYALGNSYNTNHVLKTLNTKKFEPTDTITVASNNDNIPIETSKSSFEELSNGQNLTGNGTLLATHDQVEIINDEKEKRSQNIFLKQEQNVTCEVLTQSELVRSELLIANDNNASDEIDSNKYETENNDTQDQQGIPAHALQLRLQGVLKKLALDSNISEKPSTCLSSVNTITTASNRDIKQKQDIYDKLDSVSATDSENSFHMKERKSQVINITDITNSLEDLDRLDKICRIMEISDELSDQLLSALNSNDYKELKNKKWSFKDLCERIKLDEFCNKIFNKSYS